MRSVDYNRVLAAVSLLAFVTASPAAQPPTVQIYAAGSLRGVVTALAAEPERTLASRYNRALADPAPCAIGSRRVSPPTS